MSDTETEKKARIAGAAGAVIKLGAIGSVVQGLSASSLTAYLAGTGSLVGGGMAAGIVVTAAAPLAVGGALYYGYKFLNKEKETKNEKSD